MKIVCLFGEPCSGKSTLTKLILSRLSKGFDFKQGMVTGTKHEAEKVLVLGTYDPGQTFGGTDRFSMGIQPHAEFFINQFGFQHPDWNVFFEGDRLSNVKFFKVCQRFRFFPFCIQASEETKKQRHVLRKDTQSETFLKSRATKVSNLKKAFPEVHVLTNETEDDLLNLASKIMESLK